jgi:hypothetical protein
MDDVTIYDGSLVQIHICQRKMQHGRCRQWLMQSFRFGMGLRVADHNLPFGADPAKSSFT